MLQIRFHRNWAWGPALLIAGSGDDLAVVEAFFKRWNGEEVELVSFLSSRTTVLRQGIDTLTVRRAEQEEFAIRRGAGIWSLTTKSPQRIASLIAKLLELNASGHQYLNTEVSNIEIVCAKDEYPTPISKGSDTSP